MRVLRAFALGRVGRAYRSSMRIAESVASDCSGGGQILVQERRRDLQGARNVVEPILAVIARQDLGRVDLHVQQVVHRVRVFLAVQTVQADTSRFRMQVIGGGLIDRRFERADEGAHFGFERLRVAWGRHQVTAQFADRLLPGFGILRDVVAGQGVEGQAAGPVLGVMALGAVVLSQ